VTAPRRDDLDHVEAEPEVDDQWRTRAACRGMPVSMFYNPNPWIQRTAHTVCRGCPVQDPCLAYALSTNERHGIWSGTSYKDRRRIRVRLGIKTKAPRHPDDLHAL
jgi:WhiB family transcriptional regulator, redox-sensing transcriptional regulator